MVVKETATAERNESAIGTLGRAGSALASDPVPGGPVSSVAVPSVELAPEEIGRWYGATRKLSWPVRKAWLRVDLFGADAVPADGPALLAPNHLSFLDSMLLMYALPRPVVFLGKAEYLEHPVTRRLFPAAGMIPVDRSGRCVARSLRMAADVLADGGIVGVFPEGTRSRDGLLGEGHTGVAHLALRSGAPIIPVGIVGSDLVQPPDARLPRFRGRIEYRFGAPLDLGRWVGRRDGAVKQEITEELMASIAALSGQRRRKESLT